MVLKLTASRFSSSLPDTSIRRVRSCVSATCSAASVSRRTGRSAARATNAPSSAASATPADRHEQEPRAQLRQHGVGVAEATGDLEREPVADETVATRRWTPCTVMSLRLSGDVAARGGQRLLGDREHVRR